MAKKKKKITVILTWVFVIAMLIAMVGFLMLPLLYV